MTTVSKPNRNPAKADVSDQKVIRMFIRLAAESLHPAEQFIVSLNRKNTQMKIRKTSPTSGIGGNQFKTRSGLKLKRQLLLKILDRS
jgi:hypothetical protein